MADVSVDASISQSTARGCRALVYATDLIGYMFFIDGDGVFGYCKTTDGGATWGAQVNVDGATATTTCAFDVWFDKWTKDDTGTLIHCWWFDTTNDIVRWRTLDTNGDTLGTVRNVFSGASAVAGRGSFVSGTKTLSGYLYCAFDIDAGAERGLMRSTDSGVNWVTPSGSGTFVEATLDTCKLYPAHGTGDNNDCWAVYYDASATALTLKMWDSSAVAQVESATIQTKTDGATDLTGQFGHDAMVRWSDGHLILVSVSLRDNASSTHQVFDITSTSSFATKTAITTNIDDHYYPQIFIEQGPDTLYVFYNGKRDGSEVMDTTTKVYYTKSTDGGTSWTAGDTAYMEGAAGIVQQLWTPLTSFPGSSRAAAVWRVAATLLTNKVNSIAFMYIKGVTIASGSSVSSIYGPEFVFESPATPVAMGTTLFSQTSYGTGPENEWQYDHLELYEFDRPVAAKFSNFPGGTVQQVLVTLAKHIFPGVEVTGTCTMKIRSGSYTGTVVASSTTTITPATDLLEDIPRWIAFDFPATALSAGGTYWFTLERSTTQFSSYIEWQYRLGDVVADYAGVDDLGSEDVDFEPGLIVISDTPPIAAGSGVNAPTVTPPAATVVGTTIAVGSAANAPTTVAIEQTVTGTTIAAGSGVTAPESVESGQSVTGTTLASGSAVSAPTVTYAVTGTTLAAGSGVTAPTTAYAVTGTTLAVGSAVTAPSVIQTALGATITTGSTVTAPTTVTPGAVTVIGTTLSSGSGVTVPTLAYGIAGVHRASGVVLTAPTVVNTQLVTGAFIEPDLQDHSWSTSVDAEFMESVTGLTSGWGTYLGQEFWIRQNERLTSIELRVSKTHSPTDNIYLEVYADLRSGGPAIGVSSLYPASSAPPVPPSGDDSEFVTFTFSTVVTLLPGFYAWVAKRDGTGSSFNAVNLHMDYPNVLGPEPALVWDGSLGTPDWDTSSSPYSFQYRLHFATSIFGPTTVTPGAVTVVGGTRPTTIQVFAPSTTAVALGATITSGSGVFAPRTAYALTTPTVSASSTVSVPTVAIAITTTAIAVGSQVFAAIVTPGATTVVGTTIATTAQLFALTVVEAGSLAGAFASSTSQVFVPTVVVEWAVTTAFISRSYAAVIIEDDPTLYWRLDETGATAVDEISGEIGTISGGVTSIAGPLAGGNAAMHFDGTGKIVPATNFRLHAGSWSVEGWFKRAAVPGGGNDFESWWSNGNFLNGNFYVGVHAGGTAQGQWIGATPSFIDSGLSGLIGAWHHMVVTYDGTRWRLYMDGVLRTNDAVTAATEPWPTPQKPGCIAWEPNRDRFWTGDIDEVAIYPYTLTDDQIAAHYVAASSLSLEVQAFAPTVAPGAATVVAASIATSSVVQAPTIVVGAVTILGASRGSASQVFAPMVTPIMAGATITSTVQLIAPSVTPGAVTVVATRIVSAPQMFAPVVVPGAATVLGATLVSGSQTRAPSVVMVTQGATIPTLSQVFAPVVVIEYRITTAFVSATSTVFSATVEVEIIPILVGGIDSAVEVFAPSLIARLFPTGAIALARVQVRYLVTSAAVECMMKATAGVSVRYLGVGGVTTPVHSVTATSAVRYLVESDGVSVNVLEAT